MKIFAKEKRQYLSKWRECARQLCPRAFPLAVWCKLGHQSTLEALRVKLGGQVLKGQCSKKKKKKKRAMLMCSQICWGSGARHSLGPAGSLLSYPYHTWPYWFLQGLQEEVTRGQAENRMVPGILLRSPKISTIPQATLSAQSFLIRSSYY